jgi:uncharacterized MAPEG superfamily protein
VNTELRWLIYIAMFAASLWIPYVVGVNVADFPGKKDIFHRPPDPSQMKPWVHRALRAHQNLLEQLLPFAIVVIVGTLTHVSTPITRWCVPLFFFVRVVHAVGFISGLARAPLRPILYVSGWVITLTLAWQVFTHAA